MLILAGFDLGAQDAGEFDVLGGVVGVDVVEHRQVGDGIHGQPSLVKIANTALPGSCGVHPQRVDSASTTSRPRPCSAPAAGSRLTGGSGQGSVTTTTTAPEPSRRSSSRSNAWRARVRYRVADELGGDRFDVLGVVAEFVVAQCGPDVEARHRTEYGVPGSVNATSDVDSAAAIAIVLRSLLPACWQPARTGTHSVDIARHLAIHCQAWQTGRQRKCGSAHPR